MTISDGYRTLRAALIFVLLAGALMQGCRAASAWHFENVTRQRLDRILDSSYRFDAAFVDFNGDGCYDLFVFGHEDPATSRLWLNRCDGSNTFTYSGNDQVHYYIANPTSPMGAGWMTLLDVNGDGRQDFWLRHANILAARYINGTSAGAHVPVFADKEDGCDDFCVFGDIDGDGILDVIRYDRRIERITDRAQTYPAAGTPGRRIVADVNGDGWPDLLEPEAGGFWQNNHGALVWQSRPALHATLEPMAVADFDNDGSLDLVTLDGDENTGVGHFNLFRNDGTGNFSDVTATSGLAAVPFASWFTGYGNIVPADFDNDGLTDLLIAGPGYAPSVTLLHNLGNLHFEVVNVDLGEAGSGSESFKSRAAVADFDNDGRLDIVKTQAGTNVGLWRNTTDTAGRHWMNVRVRGPNLNTDGIGTDLKWFRPGTNSLVAHMTVQASSQHPQTWVHAGLADQATVDLEVHFPNDGATYRFNGLAADQETIVFDNGCLMQHWTPGHGWPRKPPADCATHGTRTDEAPQKGHSRHARPAPCAKHANAATGTEADERRIELHRNGAKGDSVMVTLGIPFAPGELTDAKYLRIVAADGREIPAHVTTTLRWSFKDNSIRAVRAQFQAALSGDTATFSFAYDRARTANAEGWPYEAGLVDGPDGVRVPGVLATLTPQWMTASRIAGPQVPAVPPGAYDKYFATQFEWARKLPTESSAWLFDRPTTLFEQYVRTGRYDYLAAAVESYRFYMAHFRREGLPFHPFCGGGWEYEKVNPCDVKYVYVQPILMSLGLTGDDSLHDASLISHMVALWDTGGWTGIRGPYTAEDQYYTERNTGLGLLAVVAAYEITGDKDYLDDVKQRVGWLYDHQRKNPDGMPPDGAWRHSWQRHEGDAYDPKTDVRGASPWMSQNIIDGLWHAWLVTEDPRIPTMITAFGRYLERYAWIDPKILAGPGKDWRHVCSGPDGQISWYWSSSLATDKQLIAIENSDGWYSDEHDVELALPVAAARYFETDPAQRKALDRRLALLAHSYATSCATSSATPRRFNWNNRGVGVVQWFLHRFRTEDSAHEASAAEAAAR